MKIASYLIFLILVSCSLPISDFELYDRLNEFGLSLIETPNFKENRRDVTHLDYYENIELLLSEIEYRNLQNQIKGSQGFINLINYSKGLEDFKTKSWTYEEIFGQSHLSNKEIIIDPEAIEMAYYRKFYFGKWVEKISSNSKQTVYYKEASGKDGGSITILKNEKILSFYLQNE